MNPDAAEKAKARRLQRLVYALVAVFILAPMIVWRLLH